MNQLFVGMKKIPVEQGSGYNVAYYILVEEAAVSYTHLTLPTNSAV